MPTNRKQNIVFTLIMTFIMAYFMIVYNIVMNMNSFTNKTFLIALKEFPLEEIIVFLCAYFIATPLAKKLAFRFVDPKKDTKMFVILSIQSMTVLIMVGLMSLYALITKNLINSNIICNYITLYCKNFIMAYPLQIFFAGPITRNLFKKIFKN